MGSRVQADPRRPGQANRAAIAALLPAEVGAHPGEASAAGAKPAVRGNAVPCASTVHCHCSQFTYCLVYAVWMRLLRFHEYSHICSFCGTTLSSTPRQVHIHVFSKHEALSDAKVCGEATGATFEGN